MSCGTCACLKGPFFGETLASIRPYHSKERNHHTHSALRLSLRGINHFLELEFRRKADAVRCSKFIDGRSNGREGDRACQLDLSSMSAMEKNRVQ